MSSLCGDRGPNFARSPSDVLSHSTTGGTSPSNVAALHSNRGDGLRLRGYDRRCRVLLCPALLRPFQQHVGTLIDHRHEPAVQPRTTKAPPSPPPLLLFFQFVESRVSP